MPRTYTEEVETHFVEENMKDTNIEPQAEQEQDETIHYDEIDVEHYTEGAGDA
jgi:hypothetical protein